jgi:Rrf2 family protein
MYTKYIEILLNEKEVFMKLSTKGRYGLRAILDHALYSGGVHTSLYNIAERQKISVNYLEQVFSLLRKGGLIKSIKGSQGGYSLAYNPSEITVGTILRSLEGSLNVFDEETDLEAVNTLQICIKKQVWDRLNESINSVADGITLEDLVNEYRASGIGEMYFI